MGLLQFLYQVWQRHEDFSDTVGHFKWQLNAWVLACKMNLFWGACALHYPWRPYNVPHIRCSKVIKSTDSQDVLIVLCLIQTLGKQNCNKIQLCQHCMHAQKEATPVPKRFSEEIWTQRAKCLAHGLIDSINALPKAILQRTSACTYIIQSPWQSHCGDNPMWQG